MTNRLMVAALLIAMAVSRVAAFTPVKPQLVNNRQRISFLRSDRNISHGDTLTLYLSDAAGNIVTGEAIVDSVSADSVYVTRIMDCR